MGSMRSKIIQQVGDCQGLHPLVLEDILNTQQRPKAEDFGDYLYIVLKMLYLREGELTSEQVSLIVEAISLSPFRKVSAVMSSRRSGNGSETARDGSEGWGLIIWPTA